MKSVEKMIKYTEYHRDEPGVPISWDAESLDSSDMTASIASSTHKNMQQNLDDDELVYDPCIDDYVEGEYRIITPIWSKRSFEQPI
jgi:hypothetical protein